MKKFVLLTLLSTGIIFGTNEVKADWDYWAIKASDPTDPTGLKFYTVDSQTGVSTLRTTLCLPDGASGNACFQQIGENTHVDPETGELFFEDNQGQIRTYNVTTDTWNATGSSSWRLPYTNANGKVYERLTVKRKSNGEIHIGGNSWITKEENGRQKVYAKDVNGNSIPIDYTNGTKLLINGRDVEQSINNVGALSAALTGLPTIPTETKLACGLGSGTHGGDLAFSGGCASKVNEKLSFNYAAAITMPGQEYAGDFEDKFSARAGFVWKLGESTKPTQISLKEKKELDIKLSDIEEDNKILKADNKILKDKNAEIISQNAKLLARLEKLESIAFKLQKNEGLKLSQGH